MPYKFESTRLTKEHKIVGIATLVLLISLWLPWFGYRAYFGVVYSGSVDGYWHGYMYIVMILCFAILAFLALTAGMEELPFKLPIAEAQATLIATGINVVLTFISFITKPSGTSWQFGAYVGLIAAAIAAAPKLIPALQERRANKGSTTTPSA